MILFDVNVFVNASATHQEHHAVAARVVRDVTTSAAPFAVSELTLSGFVRVATNTRAFADALPLERALAFCHNVLERPNAVVVAAGVRHWRLFEGLCVATGARGPLIADAYLAALAIEHNCEWVSFDRDFARFPGLRWRSPLD